MGLEFRTLAASLALLMLLALAGCQRDKVHVIASTQVEIHYDSLLLVPRRMLLAEPAGDGRAIALQGITITIPAQAVPVGDWGSMPVEGAKSVVLFDMGARRVMVMAEQPGAYGHYSPDDIRRRFATITSCSRTSDRWGALSDYDILKHILSSMPKGSRDNQNEQRYGHIMRELLLAKCRIAGSAVAIWELSSPSYKGFLVKDTWEGLQVWLFSTEGAYRGRLVIGVAMHTLPLNVEENWFQHMLSSVRFSR